MKPTSTCMLHLFCAGLSILMPGAMINAQSTFIPLPDSSFNNSGRIQLNNYYQYYPQSLALLPNGKLVTSGYGKPTGPNDDFDGFIYQIKTDGTLDPGFGTDGHLTIDVDGTLDAAYGVAALPDNKIMVLLNSFNRVVLTRLLPNGNNDEEFGNGGFALVSEANTPTADYLLIQPDGKILVFGEYIAQGIPKGAVWRINPDGTPDISFGVDGFVAIALDADKLLSLTAAVLQPDGKILATGLYGMNATAGFPIIRLNTDGSYDNTFSGDGRYSKLMGTAARTAEAHSIAIGPDGNIYVSGYSATTNATALTVMSVTPSGGANISFGNFGTAKLAIAPFASANKILFQSDGKILLGGYCFVSTDRTLFIHCRLNPNGTADPSFGAPSTPGLFASTLNENFKAELIVDMIMLPDNRLVSLGWMNLSVNLGVGPIKAVVFQNLMDIVVATSEPSPVLHTGGVYPNPAGNGPVTLEYTLDESREISLSLFNIRGDRVADLLQGEYRAAGEHREQFSLKPEWPAGIYYAMLSTSDGIRTVQIVKQE